eukprot:1904389-Pleurochrysis_carterae.AAC.1
MRSMSSGIVSVAIALRTEHAQRRRRNDRLGATIWSTRARRPPLPLPLRRHVGRRPRRAGKRGPRKRTERGEPDSRTDERRAGHGL